ncbi:DUF4190 domain-containing protein [Cryobacterium sp. HLT2-28]|uniref:DUF4190 domain-containing protein n=1 Tax=Cryobacterium sp. HLT2-28 TaxID=1259146 RepID=UPI00106C9864|nr:DUF4190 domain-containing protein [Cryobacterium sp. HLT2-28]TFB96911.1 DUF4190 domain-containing protein [Cryobacterium sp. HLT2-28]
MSDSNTPGLSGVPHVPEVPQVPDVPHVPEVPQVPDFPNTSAAPPVAPAYASATPPPGYGAGPAATPPPPGYGAGPDAPPPYGSPPPASGAPYAPYPGRPATKQPILSILALVAGIIGILGSPVVFIPIAGGIFGLFIPAAAVVLGFLGRTKEPRAKGFWLTGIITGAIGVALALLSIVIWAVVFANIPNTGYSY